MGKNANRCPECGAFVKPENLPDHLRKAHGKSEEAARIERSRPRPRKAAGNMGLPLWAPITVVLIVAGIGVGVYVSSLPPAPPPPLTEMCVQHAGLGVHNHAHLQILVEGSNYTIPANIGIVSATCYRPLHTHLTDGEIHIELPGPRDVYLRDFFAIWTQTAGSPQVFSRTQILSYAADATHEITFSVNGVPNSAYQDLALLDGQRIVIDYHTIP
jgi:hypothetical protein